MSFPQGPSFQSFRRMAVARPKEGPVFAVGGHAIVTCLRGEGVVLMDEAGTSPVARIGNGAEVEVLAWRPRPGATRYHVISLDRQLEGWVAGASLKTCPPRPAPKLALTGKPANVESVRGARGKATRTLRARVVAKGAEISVTARASTPRTGTR